MFKKLSKKGAIVVKQLAIAGFTNEDIVDITNYKLMDIINVLRGNTYNSITGILKVEESARDVIDVVLLLQEGIPYREVAAMTEIDSNKVRNIKGYLNYKRGIK